MSVNFVWFNQNWLVSTNLVKFSNIIITETDPDIVELFYSERKTDFMHQIGASFQIFVTNFPKLGTVYVMMS
jgi:hypothetical protein